MSAYTKSINANLSRDTLNDDIDDDLFLRHPRHGSSGYLLGNSSDNTNTDWEQKRQQLLEERRQIEERTLQSSQISVGLIYESEKVGLSTAEELVRQREQLENTEEKLDSMNAMMRVSQKHLTSMKSIFGGLKNYFSRNSDAVTVNGVQHNTISSRPAVKSESQLMGTIDKIKSENAVNSAQNHPMLARRDLDQNRFDFEDDYHTDKQTSSNQDSQRSRQIEKKLDQNLTEIDTGLGRLKQLALGLGNEIGSQNVMLDRITGKAERAEDTIQYQNRQMKHILKK